jgi:hypothetical protein
VSTANKQSITYERISRLKLPEKGFSTATGDYTQNPLMSVMGMLQQLRSSLLFRLTVRPLFWFELGVEAADLSDGPEQVKGLALDL